MLVVETRFFSLLIEGADKMAFVDYLFTPASDNEKKIFLREKACCVAQRSFFLNVFCSVTNSTFSPRVEQYAFETKLPLLSLHKKIFCFPHICGASFFFSDQANGKG